MSIVEPVRDERAAIDKAFSLLVAFGDHTSSGLGVSELARRAKLSKSTAFRILGILERNGIVERVGTNYRLGPRLNDLGRAVYSPRNDRLRDLLLPYLTELFGATRNTVHLAVLHGDDVVYLAKLYGHRTVVAPSRIGGRLPANCTAVGKALLAYDPEAAAAAMATPLAHLTPRSIADPATLAAELARIRREGVAWDQEESRMGVHCVAAPVLSRTGRPIAALSVSAPLSTDLGPLTKPLRRVCAAAAQALTLSGLGRTA